MTGDKKQIILRVFRVAGTRTRSASPTVCAKEKVDAIEKEDEDMVVDQAPPNASPAADPAEDSFLFASVDAFLTSRSVAVFPQSLFCSYF